MKIKTLELFGGIGAPRSALENLNLDIKAVDYVEILANAVKAYNAMYDLSYKPQNVLDWNLNVDLLIHGSPCQDWSNAGLNDLETGRSILYQRTLEIIEKELSPRPKYVLWENVKGLISPRNYKHYNHYICEMERLGYKNYMGVLEAKEFGIPQTRPRVFTVSIRNDIDQVFDFKVLERKPMRPLSEFLDSDYAVGELCESMIKAIKNNMVPIIINGTNTITTKQMRWHNCGIKFKDDSFYNQDLSNYPLTINYSKALEYFSDFIDENDLAKTFRILSPRECWALQGYDAKESQEYKEFKNFYTIPRKKDGKMINGSYNRIWKENNFIGTIPTIKTMKIGYKDKNKIVFRELTSAEAWQLQGYSLSQYDRVKATGISDTDMYALAGNSICIPVLEAIFKELLIDKKSKAKTSLVIPQLQQCSLFEEESTSVEKYKDILKRKEQTKCKY